jgi:hypothetical protein
MSYLAFKVPDTRPADNLAALHTLQGLLFAEAERNLGPRSHSHELAPPRLTLRDYSDVQRFGSVLLVQLREIAAHDWRIATADLAHECVHMLDGPEGRPTVLEEGVATSWGLAKAVLLCGSCPGPVPGDAYSDAMGLAGFNRSVPDSLKAMRASGVRLHSVIPEDLMRFVPGIDPMHAQALCAPFHGYSPVD